MSVIVAKRKESKFEAITFSEELHDMLIDFMQRSFGIKDMHAFVRKKFNYGTEYEENYSKYRYLMNGFRDRIDHLASLMTNNLRAANALYPNSMHEYEQRRDYQNDAIINCEQLIKELQRVVEVFEVDVNVFDRYVEAIDKEIKFIKNWRQRDNKIKSYLEG